MFKNFSKILVGMVLAFTFLTTIEVNAAEDAYTITGYKIDIVVNEDNTFDITEYIEVNFNQERHGIIRNIPKENNIKRLDGSKSTIRARISNVYVDERYTKTEDSKSYNLKIGNPNETITGYWSYKIKYTYDIGNDKSKEFDELYFNLIGTEWDTTISNVEFTITMPKEFDETKLGFSSGPYGSTDSSSIVYNVDDKVIKGEYIGVLDANEALTVRLELPEGYFIKKIEFNKIFYTSVPILCLIISLYLWFKHGRDEKTIETVEFYPPLEYNSMELGFLYKAKVEDKDIVSLLIYLANKGYIKIVENKYSKYSSMSFEKEMFEIVKVKEYDGNNSYEKLFFDGLFKKGKQNIRIKDLENNFYTTSDKIKKDINRPENVHKIIQEKSLNIRKIILLITTITFLFIAVWPIYFVGRLPELLPAIIVIMVFSIFGLGVIIYSIFTAKGTFIKIFLFIWGSIFGGTPWLSLTVPFILELGLLYAWLIGVVCLIAMVLIAKHMPKRTSFGLKILSKINGFKNFLEVAKISKLEALVMENPTYFYDILPYIYVLNLSNKWISKFESINIEKPNWYHGINDFDIHSFSTSMNRTMKTATSTMTSSPSSSGGSSGGGSSGGGSSGGGSGGGGGSSW